MAKKNCKFRAKLYGGSELFHVLSKFRDNNTEYFAIKSWWATKQRWNYSVIGAWQLELCGVYTPDLEVKNG